MSHASFPRLVSLRAARAILLVALASRSLTGQAEEAGLSREAARAWFRAGASAARERAVEMEWPSRAHNVVLVVGDGMGIMLHALGIPPVAP